MDEDRLEFLQIFREETLERLANVARSLEGISSGQLPDEGQQEEVDRELHTIKGSARLLGFSELGTLVHELEELDPKSRGDAQPAAWALLLEASDRLCELVEQAAVADADQTDPDLLARIRALTEGEQASASPPASKPDPRAVFEPVDLLMGSVAAEDRDDYAQVRDPLTERVPAGGYRAQPPLDPVTERVPGPEEGRHPRPDLRGEEVEGSGGRGRKPEDELVRVRASRLGHLDELVSELSVAYLRLNELEGRLQHALRDFSQPTVTEHARESLRGILHEFRSSSQHVQRSARSLQRLAVDVRLRPVDRVFDQLPRQARALARQLGKRLRVRIQGGETELDRVLLEHLVTPLMHLVRNAVDHGLEPPRERASRGKDPEGQLVISAHHEGGNVAISIADDGRGIDADRIRLLAVERGVMPATQATQLSDEGAIDLIFVPGFTTTSKTTEVSGRGVGMDVVRTSVEQLGGEVRIESVVGRGTTTTIRLPLTQLVARVTFVRCGGQQFAIPTESMQESLRFPRSKLSTFEGQEAVLVRGRSVPVLRLGTFLGARELPDPSHLSLLLVRHAHASLALVVEDLLDERSVVVKPLGWPLELMSGFSGVVHLPWGEVALLLHVPDLFALRRQGPERVRTTTRFPTRRTVLVVDDSVMSRQLVSRYVEAMGFDLLTAVDGMDAWGILERVVPDAVVTDLEMPRLNGLNLIRRMRADERLAEVPAIVISTRGSPTDRQAGLEAGADAYLSKAELGAQGFKQTLERLL
ncbi:MAG: hybrid sensor histidine kinase/response regulator [Planctomycetes bacterium]|nr:hybrid sensor histidine kinase/response regulator [Planctomycetota bacterium]